MKKEAEMIHPIANAPCSWGVDDPKNPNLPAWATVRKEAAQAGRLGFFGSPTPQLQGALAIG